MKKLYVYLFLVFFALQTPSSSDDIRDFQIEGVSLGDSLLDYITKQEIESKKKTDYKSKKFSRTYFSLPEFEIYEGLQVHFKTSDKRYKIHNIYKLALYKIIYYFILYNSYAKQ